MRPVIGFVFFGSYSVISKDSFLSGPLLCVFVFCISVCLVYNIFCLISSFIYFFSLETDVVLWLCSSFDDVLWQFWIILAEHALGCRNLYITFTMVNVYTYFNRQQNGFHPIDKLTCDALHCL